MAIIKALNNVLTIVNLLEPTPAPVIKYIQVALVVIELVAMIKHTKKSIPEK